MNMRYVRGGETLRLDPAKCVKCGMCIEVCPQAVFRMEERSVEIADRGACMECGACEQNCPTEALEVRAGVGCATGMLMGRLTGSAKCCGDDQCCCTDSDEQEKK